MEVDLEYPKELRDLHNDYPLAPESVLITPDIRSAYSEKMGEDLEYKPAKVKKLVPNLNDKNKYILHYRNLKLYLNKGMKLTKIHRALKFKQDALLKSYIDLNTAKRSAASNAFEKDFFKLMSNRVFGKTMENISESQKYEVCHYRKDV